MADDFKFGTPLTPDMISKFNASIQPQRRKKHLQKRKLYLYCQKKQMRSGGSQRTSD